MSRLPPWPGGLARRSAARTFVACTFAGLAFAGLALAACSSPDPVLYTLAPATGAVYQGSPRVVLLNQIAIAHYLERSQIVRSSENYRLAVLENDWWGEPLPAMLGRVLVEELGQRLPKSVVIADNGAVSAEPDATIELNIQRLDENAAGNVVLQAQAAVRRRGSERPALQSFRFVVTPPAPGVLGEVAAISVAVGRLADGIAPMLTSIAPGAAAPPG